MKPSDGNLGKVLLARFFLFPTALAVHGFMKTGSLCIPFGKLYHALIFHLSTTYQYWYVDQVGDWSHIMFRTVWLVAWRNSREQNSFVCFYGRFGLFEPLHFETSYFCYDSEFRMVEVTDFPVAEYAVFENIEADS